VLQIQLEGQGQPPITVADYLKQSFGYRYNFMGAVVGILLAFTIFFAGRPCTPIASCVATTPP
jgi:dipeptide/tripeptide permease